MRNLKARIDIKKIKKINKDVYSFDVFDTCLIRPIIRPTDLFYFLFPNFSPEQKQELVRLRIEAETLARQKETQKEDITLQQIYDQLDLSPYQLDKNEIQQQEIKLELQMVQAIAPIKEQIQQLRQQGHRIIFISDMYLSWQTIQQMLINNNIASPAESLYLSSQIGLTKATGNLFKHVLETENIQPHQLHHTGDNHHSDIAIPQQLGIKTNHFNAIQPTRYESTTFTQSLAPVPIRSQIAGISRLTRLSHSHPQNLTGLAANVIAPLLTSYTAWVMQHAQQNGIKRLYFVSRDGQILLKIAQQLAHHLPSPECRYLYGSRQAWFLPSLTESDLEQLDWLMIDGQSKTPINIFKRLNIDVTQIEHILKKYRLQKTSFSQELNPNQAEIIWKIIAEPEIKSLILDKAQQSRQRTLQYFQQEGLLDATKWAIVDIGWTLKTQRSLKKLLEFNRHNAEIIGYYFGVFWHSLNTTQAGQYHAFLHQELPSNINPFQDKIFNHQSLIEQIFTSADHATVIGYQQQKDSITPKLKQDQICPEKLNFVNHIQQITLNYAHSIAQAGILDNHVNELKRLSLTNALTFLKTPTKKEVLCLATLTTSDDQNESKQRPVARPITLIDLIYFTQRALKLTSRRDYQKSFDWLEGSIALSNPLIKILYWLFTHLQTWIYQHKPLVLYRLKLKLLALRNSIK